MNRKTINRIIFFAVLVIISVALIEILAKNAEEKSKITGLMNNVKSYSNEIETFMVSFEDIPDYIAFPLGNTTYKESDLKDILRLIVSNDEEIYGTTCAFEPYKFNPDSLYFAPYYYKSGDNVFYKNLGTEEYDYFVWDWYLIPKRIGQAFWSEPYFDEGGGNINLMTYSVPIYKYDDYNDKDFLGVITVDVSLGWINKILGSVKVQKGGFALLVSKSGTVISSNNGTRNWRLKETIFSLAAEHEWKGFRKIGKKIITGEEGHSYFTDAHGNNYIVAYVPIKKSNWSLLIAVKENKT